MASTSKKSSARSQDKIVPITNTGGLVEKTKESGRNLFKELGKLARRKFARCLPLSAMEEAQRKIVGGLFTKNTGLCKHESGCIRAETCPVPEG